MSTPLEVLKAATFGSRTAEEEQDRIETYFVETDQWLRVFAGDIDIVYGQKGSGKSAIYSLILKNSDSLFDKNVIAIPGENPAGTPAFASIKDDDSITEAEFVNLWKIYLLTLIGRTFKDYGICNENSGKVIAALEGAGLIPSAFSLSKALKYAIDYIKTFRLPRISGVEGGLSYDPASNTPLATGKIVFAEPGQEAAKQGAILVDELLQLSNDALADAGYSVWVLLDRLDVAFSESHEIEAKALRALFRFYLDTKQLQMLRPKIFLRTDIWEGITRSGFREASHIERILTIQWREDDLRNLVIRRIASNAKVLEYYDVDANAVIGSKGQQDALWEKVFPAKVETGPNKPKTFNWILSRTSDAIQSAAPREIIHFLNELRDRQIARLERGERGPTEKKLFEQVTFKEALPEVSRVRLHQTLFAEFPECKGWIEALKDKKATQSVKSLSEIWGSSDQDTANRVQELERIGFLERYGAMWRVPFIYRPALSLVQGAAD